MGNAKSKPALFDVESLIKDKLDDTENVHLDRKRILLKYGIPRSYIKQNRYTTAQLKNDLQAFISSVFMKMGNTGTIPATPGQIGGWDIGNMKIEQIDISDLDKVAVLFSAAKFEITMEFFMRAWLQCNYSVEELISHIPSQHTLYDIEDEKKFESMGFRLLGNIRVNLLNEQSDSGAYIAAVEIRFPKQTYSIMNALGSDYPRKSNELLMKLRSTIYSYLSFMGASNKPVYEKNFQKLFTEYKCLAPFNQI